MLYVLNNWYAVSARSLSRQMCLLLLLRASSPFICLPVSPCIIIVRGPRSLTSPNVERNYFKANCVLCVLHLIDSNLINASTLSGKSHDFSLRLNYHLMVFVVGRIIGHCYEFLNFCDGVLPRVVGVYYLVPVAGE